MQYTRMMGHIFSIHSMLSMSGCIGFSQLSLSTCNSLFSLMTLGRFAVNATVENNDERRGLPGTYFTKYSVLSSLLITFSVS